MTAATEHDQEALVLQSTAVSANVVFIKIDWKASRHNRINRWHDTLRQTIAGVVRNMNPTMICMCEVGLASIPLAQEQMQEVADQSKKAWQDAATEHFELRCLFQVGAPYMTIYIHGPIQCSCHRILTGLYEARGQPRTAQTFLCCGPGGVTVDVINVHAPSGRGAFKLEDSQRMTVLTNLLQSNSNAMPGEAIGSARFLIGGDMNTKPFLLSALLQFCRHKGALHTQEQIIEPQFAKHGDVCFLGGFKAASLTTTAENHDPKHIPYGLCWSMVQESATEQLLSLWPAQNTGLLQRKRWHRRLLQDKSAASSGYATERPLPAPPTPAQTPEPPRCQPGFVSGPAGYWADKDTPHTILEDLVSRPEHGIILRSADFSDDCDTNTGPCCEVPHPPRTDLGVAQMAATRKAKFDMRTASNVLKQFFQATADPMYRTPLRRSMAVSEPRSALT